MISTTELVDRMKSALDAEGSDRYLFDNDFKPAINYSVEWIVSVGNKAFGTTKLSGENFRELTRTRIFQPNQFSRIGFDESEVGDELWTVNRISPEAVVHPQSSLNIRTNPEDTIYRKDLSYISSDQSARRLTQEEWDENRNNIFEAGNTTVTNKFKSYAYLNFANYNSDNYTAAASEIEIRPDVSEQFVALSYTKKPNAISLITDSIEFPESLNNIVFEKALAFISYKQGDRTNLFSVTSQDVNLLVQLIL